MNTEGRRLGCIVYVQGAIYIKDLVELLLCSENLVLVALLEHISTYFDTLDFYIPKYINVIYEIEGICK